MPVVNEAVSVTATLYGPPREGMHRNVFVGSNFVMEGRLQEFIAMNWRRRAPERWIGVKRQRV